MERELKAYAPPWEGRLLLACKKCQKKLKKWGHHKGLANLKKTMKARNKEHVRDVFHVLNVPCMDVCPKHAVAVCVSRNNADHLFILRDEEEIAQL